MASWMPSVRHWLVFSCIFVTHHMFSNARLLQQFWAAETTANPVQSPSSEQLGTFVKHWTDFGVQHQTLIGKWHNETYQATIWLRVACTNNSSDRVARLVVLLNSVPQLEFKGVHLTTPLRFLKDDKLPEIRFTSSANESDYVAVDQQYWKSLLEWKWQSSVYSGKAILRADTVYTLTMEGSERVIHMYPPSCQTSPLAQPGDVWLGMTESVHKMRHTAHFRFALLQHLRHHLKLGVKGTMMVVVPETAVMLLADPEVAAYVKQRQLVLIIWDYGLVKNAPPYMFQVPGNNLLKLALSGTGAMLGLWDVDEYLVLPRHNNISYEVTQGCLKDNLFSPQEQEAVISMTGTYAADSDQPDIGTWTEHGSFDKAVRHMNYTSRAYVHCNFGILCKALINPDADHNMHVHQLVRRPTQDKKRVDCRTPIPRDCAYMHHFYQLWMRRSMWFKWATSDKIFPLPLQDLPQ